jgi:hypothetical protein
VKHQFQNYSKPTSRNHGPESRKPWTTIKVKFAYDHNQEVFSWDALLDTGSPFTIFPGDVLEEIIHDERLEISLLALNDYRVISLPSRGPIANFGPVGSTATPHPPFCADFQIDSLNWLELQTIYFDKRLDHVIIGVDVLFEYGPICFLRESYHLGKCWLRYLCGLLPC